MSDLPPLCRGLLIGCSYVGGMAMMSMLMDIYEGKNKAGKSRNCSVVRESADKVINQSRSSRHRDLEQQMHTGRMREFDASEEGVTQVISVPKSHHYRDRHHHRHHHRRRDYSRSSSSSRDNRYRRGHVDHHRNFKRELGGFVSGSREDSGREKSADPEKYRKKSRHRRKHRRRSKDSLSTGYPLLDFSSRSVSGTSCDPNCANRERQCSGNSVYDVNVSGLRPGCPSLADPSDRRVLEIRIPLGEDGVLGSELPAEIEVSTSAGNANRIVGSRLDQYPGEPLEVLESACGLSSTNPRIPVYHEYSPLRADVCAVYPARIRDQPFVPEKRAPGGVENAGDRRSKDSSFFSTFESHTLGYSPARTTVSNKIPGHSRGIGGVDFPKGKWDVMGKRSRDPHGSSETVADGLLTESSFRFDNAGFNCPNPSYAPKQKRSRTLSDEDFKTSLTWKNFSAESNNLVASRNAGKRKRDETKPAVDDLRKFTISDKSKEKYAGGDKPKKVHSTPWETKKSRECTVVPGSRHSACSPIFASSHSLSGRESRPHSPFSFSTFRFHHGAQIRPQITELDGKRSLYLDRQASLLSVARKRCSSIPPAPRPSPVLVACVEAHAQTSIEIVLKPVEEVPKEKRDAGDPQSHDSGVGACDKTAASSLVEKSRELAANDCGSSLLDLLMLVILERLRGKEKSLVLPSLSVRAPRKMKNRRERRVRKHDFIAHRLETASRTNLTRTLSGDDNTESTSAGAPKETTKCESIESENSEDKQVVRTLERRSCEACERMRLSWSDPAVLSKTFNLKSKAFRGKRRDMHPAQPPEPFYSDNDGHLPETRDNMALRIHGSSSSREFDEKCQKILQELGEALSFHHARRQISSRPISRPSLKSSIISLPANSREKPSSKQTWNRVRFSDPIDRVEYFGTPTVRLRFDGTRRKKHSPSSVLKSTILDNLMIAKKLTCLLRETHARAAHGHRGMTDASPSPTTEPSDVKDSIGRNTSPVITEAAADEAVDQLTSTSKCSSAGTPFHPSDCDDMRFISPARALDERSSSACVTSLKDLSFAVLPTEKQTREETSHEHRRNYASSNDSLMYIQPASAVKVHTLTYFTRSAPPVSAAMQTTISNKSSVKFFKRPDECSEDEVDDLHSTVALSEASDFNCRHAPEPSPSYFSEFISKDVSSAGVSQRLSIHDEVFDDFDEITDGELSFDAENTAYCTREVPMTALVSNPFEAVPGNEAVRTGNYAGTSDEASALCSAHLEVDSAKSMENSSFEKEAQENSTESLVSADLMSVDPGVFISDVCSAGSTGSSSSSNVGSSIIKEILAEHRRETLSQDLNIEIHEDFSSSKFADMNPEGKYFPVDVLKNNKSSNGCAEQLAEPEDETRHQLCVARESTTKEEAHVVPVQKMQSFKVARGSGRNFRASANETQVRDFERPRNASSIALASPGDSHVCEVNSSAENSKTRLDAATLSFDEICAEGEPNVEDVGVADEKRSEDLTGNFVSFSQEELQSSSCNEDRVEMATRFFESQLSEEDYDAFSEAASKLKLRKNFISETNAIVARRRTLPAILDTMLARKYLVEPGFRTQSRRRPPVETKPVGRSDLVATRSEPLKDMKRHCGTAANVTKSAPFGGAPVTVGAKHANETPKACLKSVLRRVIEAIEDQNASCPIVKTEGCIRADLSVDDLPKTCPISKHHRLAVHSETRLFESAAGANETVHDLDSSSAGGGAGNDSELENDHFDDQRNFGDDVAHWAIISPPKGTGTMSSAVSEETPAIPSDDDLKHDFNDFTHIGRHSSGLSDDRQPEIFFGAYFPVVNPSCIPAFPIAKNGSGISDCTSVGSLKKKSSESFHSPKSQPFVDDAYVQKMADDPSLVPILPRCDPVLGRYSSSSTENADASLNKLLEDRHNRRLERRYRQAKKSKVVDGSDSQCETYPKGNIMTLGNDEDPSQASYALDLPSCEQEKSVSDNRRLLENSVLSKSKVKSMMKTVAPEVVKQIPWVSSSTSSRPATRERSHNTETSASSRDRSVLIKAWMKDLLRKGLRIRRRNKADPRHEGGSDALLAATRKSAIFSAWTAALLETSQVLKEAYPTDSSETVFGEDDILNVLADSLRQLTSFGSEWDSSGSDGIASCASALAIIEEAKQNLNVVQRSLLKINSAISLKSRCSSTSSLMSRNDHSHSFTFHPNAGSEIDLSEVELDFFEFDAFDDGIGSMEEITLNAQHLSNLSDVPVLAVDNLRDHGKGVELLMEN